MSERNTAPLCRHPPADVVWMDGENASTDAAAEGKEFEVVSNDQVMKIEKKAGSRKKKIESIEEIPGVGEAIGDAVAEVAKVIINERAKRGQ